MLQPVFRITTEKDEQNYARLVLEPLEKGYGHTLGVSLRRVMLSSIGGAAATQVRIAGIQHQFTTMTGLKEDIVELILNIKQLNFSITNDESEVVIKLSVKGPKTVTGADLVLAPNVNLSNPDKVLATLTSTTSKLELELTVTQGLGYSPATERMISSIGVIPVDASFSPVVKVAYKVEATRVGRQTDFDKLIFDIWTNGTIKPIDAVHKAAQILVSHYEQVLNPIVVESQPEVTYEDRIEDEVYRLTVEELDLPTRIANALRKGGYETVRDLTKAKKADIAKVKNLGEKSVVTVGAAIKQKNVTFADGDAE